MAGEGGGGGGGKGGGSTAVAALLFCVYLGVNLSALLLAAQSQRQPRRYLNSTAVTLSEMLKFAWIQYLALAFIVYVLGTYSADFVYNFQVVETTSRLDTQYYGPKIHRF